MEDIRRIQQHRGERVVPAARTPAGAVGAGGGQSGGENRVTRVKGTRAQGYRNGPRCRMFQARKQYIDREQRGSVGSRREGPQDIPGRARRKLKLERACVDAPRSTCVGMKKPLNDGPGGADAACHAGPEVLRSHEGGGWRRGALFWRSIRRCFVSRGHVRFGGEASRETSQQHIPGRHPPHCKLNHEPHGWHHSLPPRPCGGGKARGRRRYVYCGCERESLKSTRDGFQGICAQSQRMTGA
jgi:hypothetical protein